MDDTLELIKLRVAKSYKQMKISEADAKAWDPELVSAKEMAALVYQLYASQQRTESTVQIENAINLFNFGFDLADKQIEEISHQNIDHRSLRAYRHDLSGNTRSHREIVIPKGP